MSLIVIHTRNGKRHVADPDAPELKGAFVSGDRRALCHSITFGKTADYWASRRFRPRESLDADPWCKRCEKRAREAGLIA